jgi:hypothetical protein
MSSMLVRAVWKEGEGEVTVRRAWTGSSFRRRLMRIVCGGSDIATARMDTDGVRADGQLSIVLDYSVR